MRIPQVREELLKVAVEIEKCRERIIVSPNSATLTYVCRDLETQSDRIVELENELYRRMASRRPVAS